MTKIKIKVTKEILERSMMCGVNSGSVVENCAIALAVRDLFPKAIVGHFCIAEDDYSKEGILLPEEATKFIIKFDSLKKTPEKRLELTPIEFEVEIPDSWLEDISIDELKEIITNSQTLELV